MSRELKLGKQEKGKVVAEKVVVAVKASNEVSKTALVWALTHVVQPGECITLLVVVPWQSSGRKWGFPRFAGDCASGHHRSHSATSSEQKLHITDSCSQMILQLHDVYDPNKINVKIKLVSGSPCGAVAAEAKKTEASWIVLDKHLKHEEKPCMEQLQCNIVIMKKAQPKVLRLRLVGSPKKEPEVGFQLPSKLEHSSDKLLEKNESLDSVEGSLVTLTSSPELFTANEAGTLSVSTSDPGTSPFLVPEIRGDHKQEQLLAEKENCHILDESSTDSESENFSTYSSSLGFEPWMAEIARSRCQSSRSMEESSQRSKYRIQASNTKALHEKFSRLDGETGLGMLNYRPDLEISGNVRETISISRNASLRPPPLCSICQHKSPTFGKPPRWFTFAELELATGGFSQTNFLAEGGFGSVHRGILPDGQAVAVKQHKLANFQGDQEFCSEVEVLSCAQH